MRNWGLGKFNNLHQYLGELWLEFRTVWFLNTPQLEKYNACSQCFHGSALADQRWGPDWNHEGWHSITSPFNNLPQPPSALRPSTQSPFPACWFLLSGKWYLCKIRMLPPSLLLCDGELELHQSPRVFQIPMRQIVFFTQTSLSIPATSQAAAAVSPPIRMESYTLCAHRRTEEK